MKYPLQIRMHHLETREQDPEEMISFLPLAAIKRIKRGRAAGTLARKKKKMLVTMEMMKMTFREPCDCFQRKSMLAFQL